MKPQNLTPFRRGVLIFAVVVGLCGARVADAQSYVGAERCGQCHTKEYQQWKAGPHAQAFATLTEGQRADNRCANCHMTLADNWRGPTTGVQCEDCHGSGRYYHPEYVMRDAELSRAVGLRDPSEAMCRGCHTESAPSVHAFDFSAMWARIAHGPKAPVSILQDASVSSSAKATP